MHLVLQCALIEILKQYSQEEVEEDLLSEYDEHDKEQSRCDRPCSAIVIVIYLRLRVISQYNEDSSEGV